MKVSTKGRYGLRAVLDIAVHSAAGMVRIKDIADRQKIPEKYLEQLLVTLRNAEILKSIKGSQGGYLLAKSPLQIKVGVVLSSLEGDLTIMASKEKGTPTSTEEKCIENFVWTKLDDLLLNYLNSVTLEDLVRLHASTSSSESLMFHI